MDFEITEPPSTNPEDSTKEGLKAWTATWVEYRDEVVAHLEILLSRHDNAHELAPELREFFAALERDGDEPRRWRLAIIARDARELSLRHYGDSYERELLTRFDDGTWQFAPTDHQGLTDATGVAKKVLATLLWWGDLMAIYSAKSYLGAASFIPPEGCDDWW